MSTDIEKLVREAVSKIVGNGSDPEVQRKRIDFISLADAKLLCEKVEMRAREMGVNAVVAIADEGGNLKICECMDNS